MLKTVLFHPTVLLENDPERLAELHACLHSLRAQGVHLGVVSTHPVPHLNTQLAQRSLPLPDAVLTGKKGTAERLSQFNAVFGTLAQETLYVGVDRHDYFSSIHSGAFFLLASWAAGDAHQVTCLRVSSPQGLWSFCSHFLLHPPAGSSAGMRQIMGWCCAACSR